MIIRCNKTLAILYLILRDGEFYTIQGREVK